MPKGEGVKTLRKTRFEDKTAPSEFYGNPIQIPRPRDGSEVIKEESSRVLTYSEKLPKGHFKQHSKTFSRFTKRSNDIIREFKTARRYFSR